MSFFASMYVFLLTQAKEQSDLIKSIEINIDQCIQALIARKEVLIREVTSKIAEKRKCISLFHDVSFC